MTETPEGIAQAQAAQAAGEAAAAAHVAWAESMQSTIAGSEVAIEAPDTVDDVMADSIGTPVQPAAVSPQPTSSPNVANPLTTPGNTANPLATP